MYPTRQCIANKQGDVSIVSISRAITIGTPQEDVALSKFTSYKHLHSKIMLFLKLKVNASLGYPLPYLVDKVFKDGTTAQFNIGY
jgi:hypothetical protein